MKSVKKIKSVASALSVIDFEHLWSSRSDEHVNSVCVGTVFQTAAFFLFLDLLGLGFPSDCICACTAQDSLHQEIIRDNHSARQAQTNHK